MNSYTLDPPNSETTTASAPAPAYTPSTGQYPKLESTAIATPAHVPHTYQYPHSDPTMASAPMMVPVYMPPNYQYPRPELNAVSTPAPMVAPVYIPSAQQHQPHRNVQADLSKIRDWLPWSIINLFLGGLITGLLPLIFSLLCRSKKKKNDINGARTMSTLALVFNIIVTVLGIISLIGLVVYLVAFSQSMKNQIY